MRRFGENVVLSAENTSNVPKGELLPELLAIAIIYHFLFLVRFFTTLFLQWLAMFVSFQLGMYVKCGVLKVWLFWWWFQWCNFLEVMLNIWRPCWHSCVWSICTSKHSLCWDLELHHFFIFEVYVFEVG